MECLADLKIKLCNQDNSINEEDIVTVIEYDLKKDGSFCQVDGIVGITKEKIVIYEDGNLINTISLSDIDRLECRNGVGCCFIDYFTKDNEAVLLCRGDSCCEKAFALITRRFNRYLDGEGFDYDYEKELFSRCPKCGRNLSNTTGICTFCTKKSVYVKRLWEMVKPHKAFWITAILLYFVGVGVNLLSPYLSQILVDEYVKADEIKPLASFALVLVCILVVNLLKEFISMIRTLIMTRLSGNLVVELREMLFSRIEKMSLMNQSKYSVGMLMFRVTGDTNYVNNFLSSQFIDAIQQITVFIAVGIFLFVYDWKLALIILFPMPIIFFISRVYNYRMWKMYRRENSARDKMSTVMNDILYGIRVVKSYGTENRENKRFVKASKQLKDIAIKNETFFSIFGPTMAFFMSIGSYFLLLYGGRQILDGNMTLGYMMMLTSYVNLIYGPLQWMTELPQTMARFTSSLARIFDLVDAKNDVEDSSSAINHKIEGNIEINNVSFGYNSGTEVLHNINLKVNPGDMIGIVGRSGVGKSTLINLIMRLYDVDDGEILIDGINIKDYSQESLRSQMGVVLQETFLFTDSIYANIAYAKPNATYDEVIRAAKMSGAHDFIMKLPDAYNTRVGEKGYTLSGGERQRISIARAVLHDPKILILDEATSSLDTETEKNIQDALQVLIKDRTTFAIAHRLSTLRNATKLLVLDRGRVAEFGSHDELMKKKGIYYGLIMAQRQMTKRQ